MAVLGAMMPHMYHQIMSHVRNPPQHHYPQQGGQPQQRGPPQQGGQPQQREPLPQPWWWWWQHAETIVSSSSFAVQSVVVVVVILDTEKEFEKYNENRINSACCWNISYVIYQIKVLIYMWPDFLWNKLNIIRDVIIKYYVKLQHFEIYSWTSDFHVFKKPAKPVKSDSSTKRPVDAIHCSGSAWVGLAPTAQHQTHGIGFQGNKQIQIKFYSSCTFRWADVNKYYCFCNVHVMYRIF